MTDSARESGGSTLLSALPMVIVLLVAALGGGQIFMMATSDEYQQRMEQEVAEAEAYCEQVYQNGDTYNAAVVGGHGGLHCVYNEHGPHLHEIPEARQEQALRAQQNGTDLGWTVEDAGRHDSEKPDEIPLLGIYPRDLPIIGGVTFGIIGVAVGIGMVQRYRQD